MDRMDPIKGNVSELAKHAQGFLKCSPEGKRSGNSGGKDSRCEKNAAGDFNEMEK